MSRNVRSRDFSAPISVFIWLVNCPVVNGEAFSSDDKLFHADGSATEKLCGSKLTVVVLV